MDDKFFLEGTQRISVRSIIAREIVSNILMHREYSSPFPAKVIIEKNTQSISIAKILGYNSREITGIYIRATTIVTLLSLVVTIPITEVALKAAWRALMMQYSGWMNMDIPAMVYVETILLGAATYAVVAFFLGKKAKRVPMDEALKNLE